MGRVCGWDLAIVALVLLFASIGAVVASFVLAIWADSWFSVAKALALFIIGFFTLEYARDLAGD